MLEWHGLLNWKHIRPRRPVQLDIYARRRASSCSPPARLQENSEIQPFWKLPGHHINRHTVSQRNFQPCELLCFGFSISSTQLKVAEGNLLFAIFSSQFTTLKLQFEISSTCNIMHNHAIFWLACVELKRLLSLRTFSINTWYSEAYNDQNDNVLTDYNVHYATGQSCDHQNFKIKSSAPVLWLFIINK